jgi:hypothetical protein
MCIGKGMTKVVVFIISMKFVQIPQLTYNGEDIPQSKAIERFLAKKFGFFGKNEVDAALIDAFSEQIRDININYNQVSLFLQCKWFGI